MSTDGDGNGDGDFVTFEVFSQFKANNSTLCQSYRDHVNTKIEDVEKAVVSSKVSQQWTIGICVSVSTILLMLMNWYLAVRGV